ncbi:MAG: hypothetical protein ACYTGQ_18645, partial [Planctomycetota bacterium]
WIVSPALLPPERENMLCGRCHDRVAGADDRQNDQPLNSRGEMPPPGIDRATYLAEYTSRKGPNLSSLWTDGLHSKSHHQQYSDLIKSAHYRNSRRLVVCSDCHALHGEGGFDGDLRGSPHDGSLCATCHVIDLNQHVIAATGVDKGAGVSSCVECHYYKTAKTGAGRMGRTLGPPTGGPSDEDIVYWRNDISSHLTVVPTRGNAGFVGSKPGKAMPIPYTHECGTCHN